jgi:hypothetical protein
MAFRFLDRPPWRVPRPTGIPDVNVQDLDAVLSVRADDGTELLARHPEVLVVETLYRMAESLFDLLDAEEGIAIRSAWTQQAGVDMYFERMDDALIIRCNQESSVATCSYLAIVGGVLSALRQQVRLAVEQGRVSGQINSLADIRGLREWRFELSVMVRL